MEQCQDSTKSFAPAPLKTIPRTPHMGGKSAMKLGWFLPVKNGFIYPFS